MDLRNKIIAGVATLGILGAGVATGIDNACIDENGLTMFPAETLALREVSDDRVVSVGMVCFRDKADYVTLKDSKIAEYKALKPNERGKFLWSKGGQIVDDILDHEIKKIGKLDLGKVTEKDDIFLLIINKLK